MQDSRLLQVFEQLSKKEIRELGKFVNSPFHNQRQDVVLLFQYLRKFVPLDNQNLLNKSVIFSHLYPNEVYNEKKIRYTISFLYQTIKDFLAITAFKANKSYLQTTVVQSLRKRGLKQVFEKEFKLADSYLQKSALRNQDYYFQNYLLQRERYLFTTSQTRGQAAGLKEYADQLDQFFIINKLRQSARALTHSSLDSSEYQPTFLSEFLTHLNQKNSKKNPAIEIYFHCFKILETRNSLSYFRTLRQLMSQHHHCFPPNELQDIYTFALNYCIKQLNAREMAFGREAFELYKEGLQAGIFFENSILSQFNYKNIVALGLGLKEFEWVVQFIENYKPYLDKKHRESAYNYNLALLHYRTENYGKAMELLQKVGTKDVYNNLTARRMLVCIYYDQGEFDALQSLLDSFQNYIYRKRGLGYHKRMYLNFIKYSRKLLQLDGMSSQQIQQLQKEIEGTRNVAEKEWLLEQVGQ